MSIFHKMASCQHYHTENCNSALYISTLLIRGSKHSISGESQLLPLGHMLIGLFVPAHPKILFFLSFSAVGGNGSEFSDYGKNGP